MQTKLNLQENTIGGISAATLWASLSLWLVLGACQPARPVPLAEGNWIATLSLAETAVMPFQASLERDVNGALTFTIHNADERIVVDEIRRSGDSLYLDLPVFNSRIEAVALDAAHLVGVWRDFSRGDDYNVPFAATHSDQPRFLAAEQNPQPLAPTWDMQFSPDSEADHYPAIGQFTQEGDRVTGTILTETGDYRYLEGTWDKNGLRLSAFDGSHAFLFLAEQLSDSTLQGTFYSGNHWREPFVARIDPNAQLRKPDALTFLKPGYEEIAFTFPDMNGEPVSLSDARFAGKVVIVQILGSWCPNCMDETRLYGDWYRQYNQQGLEIVGVAFERIGDADRAVQSVQRMAERLGADYTLLLAELTDSKTVASEAFPMLNQVISFPTSIFIDRKGAVRQIHTGFNGPGTGVLYEAYVEEYSRLIEELLAESASGNS